MKFNKKYVGPMSEQSSANHLGRGFASWSLMPPMDASVHSLTHGTLGSWSRRGDRSFTVAGTWLSWLSINLPVELQQRDISFAEFKQPVAVLPGWHEVATLKKPLATPQATSNENMNFGT